MDELKYKYSIKNIKVKLSNQKKPVKLPTKSDKADTIKFYMPGPEMFQPMDRRPISFGIKLELNPRYLLLIKSYTLLETTNGIFVFPTFIAPSDKKTVTLTIQNFSSGRVMLQKDQLIAEGILIPIVAFDIKEI